QGLMDLGATICTPRSPSCPICPLAAICAARAAGRQEELPVLPARRPPPEIVQRVALVTRGGAWLVARREPRGLHGGLWELPATAALTALLLSTSLEKTWPTPRKRTRSSAKATRRSSKG